MQFSRSKQWRAYECNRLCIYIYIYIYIYFTRVSCEKHRLLFFAIAQQRTQCARIWLRANTRAADLKNMHPASIIASPNITAWFRVYRKPRRNRRTKAEITDDPLIYPKYTNSQLSVNRITVVADVWYRSAGANPFLTNGSWPSG